MKKIIYGAIVVISFLFLVVVYFTNIIFMGSYTMFLGSRENMISVGAGLGLIIIVSIILGFFLSLWIGLLFTKKPRDFDEFDDL